MCHRQPHTHLTCGFGHLSTKLRKELVELLGAIKQPK